MEIERYGDLTFYTLSSGTVISLFTEELQRDWFSIEMEDIDGDDDNETAVQHDGRRPRQAQQP